MGACWPVSTGGEEIITFPIPGSILTPYRLYKKGGTRWNMFVWDTQTGVIIKHINTVGFGDIFFHRNQRMITLIRLDVYRAFNLYEEPESTQESWDKLLSSRHDQGSTYWVHNDSLLVATSSNTEGRPVVNIQELQPTSDPPVLVVESFYIPPQDGVFSFSPASFHGSFVTTNGVTILDVQDSRTLLSTQVTQQLHTQLGHFSPDGCFFACGTSENGICIWANTPSGYIPWSTLQPRLPFNKFSFSPTVTSILTWGPGGIQLLHLGNSASPPSLNETKPLHQSRVHLVTCSADGKYIATTQQEDGVVTLLDPLFGTPLQSIHVDVQIRDIKIVNNILFVADGCRLFMWNLESGGMVDGTKGVDISSVCDTVAVGTHMDNVDNFALSDDCSHIAFTIGSIVFLYNIAAQKTLTHIMGSVVEGISFSQDGCQLCVYSDTGYTKLCFPELKAAEDWFSKDVTKFNLADKESWVDFFQSPHGYYVERMSEWVVNSRDALLWLPPNWRTNHGLDMRWCGRFLALVGSHHQEPIIIEFQPQPHSNSHSICSLDT